MSTEDSDFLQQPSSPQSSLPLKTAFRNAREKLGLTQEALASRLGYERTVIARIETGRTMHPSGTFLKSCEEALNLVPGTLQQLATKDNHKLRLSREESGVQEHSRAYKSFPYVTVDRLFAAARKRIRILQTWIPDIHPLLPGIQEALLNGAKLEILVVDPQCTASSLRLHARGISRRNYAGLNLRMLMIELESLRTAAGGAWEVKVYSSCPSIQMYGTEDSVVLGFFWNNAFSLHAPQIEVSTRNSSIGQQAWAEFNYLWPSARQASSPAVDFGD